MQKLSAAIVLAAAALANAAQPGPALAAAGLTYHGGPVLVTARTVFIFWGPTFATAGSADFAYAQALQAFRNQLGTSGHYDVITQYYQVVGGDQQFIELTNLGGGTPDWFDTSSPPTNVTDAKVQTEVSKYLASNAFDVDTLYAVVIPSTSYSSVDGETSCGGPNLAYCTYHTFFTSGSDTVVYSIQPYPSCAGCQLSGATTTADQESFVCHNVRESATDPLGTGWWSPTTGQEGDELCGGTSTATNPCGKTWSNAASKCVSTM